jgi:hypothetical protein
LLPSYLRQESPISFSIKLFLSTVRLWRPGTCRFELSITERCGPDGSASSMAGPVDSRRPYSSVNYPYRAAICVTRNAAYQNLIIYRLTTLHAFISLKDCEAITKRSCFYPQQCKPEVTTEDLPYLLTHCMQQSPFIHSFIHVFTSIYPFTGASQGYGDRI